MMSICKIKQEIKQEIKQKCKKNKLTFFILIFNIQYSNIVKIYLSLLSCHVSHIINQYKWVKNFHHVI